MTRPLTREEAARTLGLPVSSDVPAVKRAYRRLAREHHPDLGGDPGTFQELQRAYERLAADDAPAPPTVSRGRPSRPPVAFTDETVRADLSTVDWTTALPDGGRVPLDVDRLAVWLATPPDGGAGEGGGGGDVEGRLGGDRDEGEAGEHPTGVPPTDEARTDDRSTAGRPLVRDLLAMSRAPGSRLNRAAHLMAAELTSQLRIVDAVDDRGHAMVGVEVTANSRRARRALDVVRLDGGWVRTRGSSSTRLRTLLPPSEDRRATAVRVADRVTALLDELGWPLSAWTLELPLSGNSLG